MCFVEGDTSEDENLRLKKTRTGQKGRRALVPSTGQVINTEGKVVALFCQ